MNQIFPSVKEIFEGIRHNTRYITKTVQQSQINPYRSLVNTRDDVSTCSWAYLDIFAQKIPSAVRFLDFEGKICLFNFFLLVSRFKG
ncbi:MAG: hypothetical protein UW69_C0034G0010 [Microgenomates group bacterium GW2011_GWA2_44_7]|nr:MAG: hypothetical protein UW69_C0034G0010 [Microgenomates group bacterium GW2011_GWA2_44_7]